jgi:hypothetical protein
MSLRYDVLIRIPASCVCVSECEAVHLNFCSTTNNINWENSCSPTVSQMGHGHFLLYPSNSSLTVSLKKLFYKTNTGDNFSTMKQQATNVAVKAERSTLLIATSWLGTILI